MRTKIDYGIDLGTTNSAIARIEIGKVRILKSDELQMDTTPSCVSVTKTGALFIGPRAVNALDKDAISLLRNYLNDGAEPGGSTGFAEFKRTMGTDKQYKCEYVEQPFSSEDLSAEVLKKLRSYVRDESIEAAVITVPAMFRQNQVDATQRAAELAGFKYCELLQEPIAASIAYGMNAASKDGYWFVFDFGGGTFDAALMKVEEGIMKVIDTEGDNHLGGKNIDLAIINSILIPALQNKYDLDSALSTDLGKTLTRGALKRVAEEAKIDLTSKDKCAVYLDDFGKDASGEEMILDLKITIDDFKPIVTPIYQSAIDISLVLLKRNGLRGSDIQSIILVGGPTFSPVLRKMLSDQISPKTDTSVDPMTAVAEGAALFASTKGIPPQLQKRDTSKAQLTLKYPETTVESEETLGIRIDREKSAGTLPKTLSVEVSRDDRGWSSGRQKIVDDNEVLTIQLNEGKSNLFRIDLFDDRGNAVQCEPADFTIIQGLKIANATLPWAIGIEALETSTGIQGIYRVHGLEKNKTLPAKGKRTLKTSNKDLRPGNKADRFTIQIYEHMHGAEGSRAILNQPIGIYTFSGDNLSKLLPANSDVEITLNFDASRRVKLTVYIPLLDETFETVLKRDLQTEDPDALSDDIMDARGLIERVEAAAPDIDLSGTKSEIDELDRHLENSRTDLDAIVGVREKLRKIFINLDKIEREGELPRLKAEMNDALERLLVQNNRYGDEKTTALVAEYQKKVKLAARGKDSMVVRQLTDEMREFAFALVREDVGVWISYIKSFDQDFETLKWSDRRQARKLLNGAKAVIATGPTTAKLESFVRDLFQLLPQEEKARRRNRDEVLRL